MTAPAKPRQPWLVLLLQQHALLAMISITYFIGASWLSARYVTAIRDEKLGAIFSSFYLTVPQMIFFVLFWRIIQLTYVQREPDRFRVLKSEVLAFLSERDRLLGGFLAVALMTLTLLGFAQMKNLIPLLNPFSWDVAFMQLDNALHFGDAPHVYLYAVFGWHYVISFFTGIYNIWLFLMYFMLLLACFMRPESTLRMQYLIAFILIWAIGGNLIATVFSSAGPVYYEVLGLGDTYAGLMGQLKAHADTGALTVVNTQSLLWFLHTHPNGFNGISAFPSMHVTSSVLMAIFASRCARWAGWLMWTFAAGMMIGSVLLGWHYAVDGYVGCLIAFACWYCAGFLVRGIYRSPVLMLNGSQA